MALQGIMDAHLILKCELASPRQRNTEAIKALNRCLVLNNPELRSALRGVYEGAESLTAEEWRALLGARRQLETAAARQRREWLREALAESGLPKPLAWVIEKRLKGRDFTPEELEAEIQAAWEKLAGAERLRRQNDSRKGQCEREEPTKNGVSQKEVPAQDITSFSRRQIT